MTSEAAIAAVPVMSAVTRYSTGSSTSRTGDVRAVSHMSSAGANRSETSLTSFNVTSPPR